MQLNKDPDMITVMQFDLVAKAQLGLQAIPDLNAKVKGVFSIDDLEAMNEQELAEMLAVGVGYFGCQPTAERTGEQFNGERGNAARMLDFHFLIIIACPANDQYSPRSEPTTLLTVLRSAILGTTVGMDRVQRMWEFIQEKPEIADSTRTMLYYSQLWRVVMPIASKPQQ